MREKILFFLLFILPLIFIPNLSFGFEPPKVLLAEILIEVLFILILIKEGWRFFRESAKFQILIIGLLFLLSLVTFLKNPDPNLYGNVFRLQGPWLFWHLILLSLLTPRIVISFEKYKNLYLISLAALFISTVFLGTNLSSRAIGSLGEPNALGATTLFVFSFVLMTQRFFWKIGGFVILGLILHFTKSNSAVLSLIIISLYYFLTKIEKFPIRTSFLVSLFLVICILLTPILDRGTSVENRLEIWRLAFQTGLESPWVGHGFGNTTAMDIYAEKLPGELKNLSIDSSHNLLLDFWVQGGFVGLSLFLLLLVLSLRSLVTQEKVMESLVFLGLFTMSLFNPLSVVNLIALWWVVGRGFKLRVDT